MSNLARFEIKIPRERREALQNLAAELDTSPSELARQGLIWVLASRDLLLRGPAASREAA